MSAFRKLGGVVFPDEIRAAVCNLFGCEPEYAFNLTVRVMDDGVGQTLDEFAIELAAQLNKD